MHDGKTIYRVAVEGLHCRSSRELVNLSFSKLAGVEATAIDDHDVLAVFADAAAVHPSDVVRTLIATGFVPASEVTEAEVSVIESQVASEPAAAQAAAQMPAGEVAEAEAELLPASVAVATDESLAGDDDGAWSPKEAFEAPVTYASPQASLVQRIRVEVSDNYYPNRIDVIPGVPVEIEFGEGHGCLAHVLFEDFGIDQDLTQSGGVVRLPGLTPGEYRFSCGMRMVFGKVVAQG